MAFAGSTQTRRLRNNRMVPALLPLILWLIWAPVAHSVAAPRHDLDAGAGLLRREPSNTESFEVSDGRAVTSKIPLWNFTSELQSFSSEHEQQASSKRVLSISERMRTSFAETEKLKQETRAIHKEEIPLLSRLRSEVWRASEMKPLDGGLKANGFSSAGIHGCNKDQSENPCDFTGCGGSDGHTGICRNGNCYSVATADTSSCNGVADGTDVPGSIELFCNGGFPTRVCPPKSCHDLLNSLGGEDCSVLTSEDPGFCSNLSLAPMISMFCRFTCGLCRRATCADATGAASCPAESVAKTDRSALCSDTSCDVSSVQAIDFSKCCIEKAKCGDTPTCPSGWVPRPANSFTYCAGVTCSTIIDDAVDVTKCCQSTEGSAGDDRGCNGKKSNNSNCNSAHDKTGETMSPASCLAKTECCPAGFTCKLPQNGQIEACVGDNEDQIIVSSVKCSKGEFGRLEKLVAFIGILVFLGCGVGRLYDGLAAIFVIIGTQIQHSINLNRQEKVQTIQGLKGEGEILPGLAM